jgi:hypothetical protein
MSPDSLNFPKMLKQHRDILIRYAHQRSSVSCTNGRSEASVAPVISIEVTKADRESDVLGSTTQPASVRSRAGNYGRNSSAVNWVTIIKTATFAVLVQLRYF